MPNIRDPSELSFILLQHKPRTSSICVSSRVCPAIFPLLSAYTLLCFISHAYHEIEIRVSSTLDLCSVSSLCGASWDPFSGITRLRAGSEHQSALVILSRQSLYSKTLSNKTEQISLNNEATLNLITTEPTVRNCQNVQIKFKSK